MKNFIRYLIVLGLIVATADICEATPVKPQISATFEMLSKPAKGGLVQIKLKIMPLRDMNEVEFRIRKTYRLDDFTLPVKTLKVKKGEVSEILLNVNIPANDTSGIHIYVVSVPRYVSVTPAIYFVTTGDTLETFPGNPRGHNPKIVVPEDNKLDRDTLTTEQLNKIYHIGFSVGSPEQIDFVKQYVDSLIPDGRFYRAFITLETVLKIEDNNPYNRELDMDVIPDTYIEPISEPTKPPVVITTGMTMTESELLLARKQNARVPHPLAVG